MERILFFQGGNQARERKRERETEEVSFRAPLLVYLIIFQQISDNVSRKVQFPPNFHCNKYLYGLSECDDSWRDTKKGWPSGGRNCGTANLRTLSERRRLAKGRKDILSNYTYCRRCRLPAARNYIITELHGPGTRSCSRGVRIHLLVCTLSIRGETIYQNEKGKWKRGRGGYNWGKWVKEKKKFVEFICSCIFDETGKLKERKTRDNWRNYR